MAKSLLSLIIFPRKPTEALNWSRDFLIPRNPSSTIFRDPHPRCFPGPGNQLRKPRIHGRSNYFDNKKYNHELSQHLDCRGCAWARAHIFVNKLGGNEG